MYNLTNSLMELFTFSIPSYNQQPNYTKASFFPNNKTLLLFDLNSPQLRFFNIQKRKIIGSLISRDLKMISHSIFSPNGTELLLTEIVGGIEVWDYVQMKLTYSDPNYHDSTISRAIYIDQTIVASTSHDRIIKIYDYKQQQELFRINTQKKGIFQPIAYSKEYRLLAAPTGNEIKLWDLRKIDYKQQPIAVLKGHNRDIVNSEFHNAVPNILITSGADNDRMIWKWNVLTGNGECVYYGQGMISEIQLFNNSQQILFSKQNEIYIIKDTEQPRKLQYLKGINSISLTSSDKYLALSDFYGKIQLFDIAT